jgi:hypothetical protein
MGKCKKGKKEIFIILFFSRGPFPFTQHLCEPFLWLNTFESVIFPVTALSHFIQTKYEERGEDQMIYDFTMRPGGMV